MEDRKKSCPVDSESFVSSLSFALRRSLFNASKFLILSPKLKGFFWPSLKSGNSWQEATAKMVDNATKCGMVMAVHLQSILLAGNCFPSYVRLLKLSQFLLSSIMLLLWLRILFLLGGALLDLDPLSLSCFWQISQGDDDEEDCSKGFGRKAVIGSSNMSVQTGSGGWW